MNVAGQGLSRVSGAVPDWFYDRDMRARQVGDKRALWRAFAWDARSLTSVATTPARAPPDAGERSMGLLEEAAYVKMTVNAAL
jgi:hypothetical protein